MPNLYYTNSSGDGQWATLANWNTAPDGTGDEAIGIPWTVNYSGGGAWYADYDLVDATGGAGADTWFFALGYGITGSCDIANITTHSISSGTFTGTNLFIGGDVYGGTFLGDNCTLGSFAIFYGDTVTGDNFTNNGYIMSGLFTSDNFNSYGYIANGTFSGANFTNNAPVGDPFQFGIDGGTFTGANFTNNGGIIRGGTFNIDGFTNTGSIQFSAIQITSGGIPYTGSWENQIWDSGSWDSGSWVSGPPVLYYTNASSDGLWSTLDNWNTSADGTGDIATNIPWYSDGAGGAYYADYNLLDAAGGIGITINNSAVVAPAAVTGTCDIPNITSFAHFIFGISGGTFTGSNFTNNSTINGGTFTGSNFRNNNTINGGTFSGANFGNFGGFINGGTFSGADFSSPFGGLQGGTFIPPAVTVSASGGMTSLSITGCPTYSYPTPTPPSGGGGGIDIARLIGLPPFITL